MRPGPAIAFAGPGLIDLDSSSGRTAAAWRARVTASRSVKAPALHAVSAPRRGPPAGPGPAVGPGAPPRGAHPLQREGLRPLPHRPLEREVGRRKRPSRRGAPSGIDAPSPFSGATFYAPQQPRSTLSTETGRELGAVSPYSYSLSDVIERGLFTLSVRGGGHARRDLRHAGPPPGRSTLRRALAGPRAACAAPCAEGGGPAADSLPGAAQLVQQAGRPERRMMRSS